MSDLIKKYVIEKEGYDSAIVVNLTEREARVIEKFLDWACLDDNFCIESVEEYEADEWGSDGTNIGLDERALSLSTYDTLKEMGYDAGENND